MDVMTKAQRRKNMQAIRSQSKLENTVSRELWKKGLRFRKNDKTLFGKPDISIKKYKIVIFIDSCFWHYCKEHGRIPETNKEFWIRKLEKNVKRDKEVTEYYVRNNWNIKRVWEHDINADLDAVVNDLANFIEEVKKGYS